MMRLNCHACLASAAKLDARAEFFAPFALVGLAPLQLAGLKGRTTNDDFEAFVLVWCAGDTLEVTFGHYTSASEALAMLRGMGGAEQGQGGQPQRPASRSRAG